MLNGIFRKAAHLLHGPENYSRMADGAVINSDTTTFCLTGLLERANCRDTNSGKVRGDPALLANAKSALCRRLGAVHLDDWEWRNKPKWREVKAMLESVAC